MKKFNWVRITSMLVIIFPVIFVVFSHGVGGN